MTQKIEIEVTEPSREKPGLRDQQYLGSILSRWPNVIYAEKCEFQYQAFRSAYQRKTYGGGLSDAELRVRWLDFYVCYKDRTLSELDAFADRAAGRTPRSAGLDERAALVFVVVGFLLFLYLIK